MQMKHTSYAFLQTVSDNVLTMQLAYATNFIKVLCRTFLPLSRREEKRWYGREEKVGPRYRLTGGTRLTQITTRNEEKRIEQTKNLLQGDKDKTTQGVENTD